MCHGVKFLCLSLSSYALNMCDLINIYEKRYRHNVLFDIVMSHERFQIPSKWRKNLTIFCLVTKEFNYLSVNKFSQK